MTLNHRDMALNRPEGEPITVYFDVTSRCNKACPVCPLRDRKIPPGDMDFDFYKSIIDQLPPETTVSLHQTGEPTLHPRLSDMARYAKVHGLFVSFTTNGLLLGKLREELVEIVDSIWVSFMDVSAVDSIEIFLRYKGMRNPNTFIKAFFIREYTFQGRMPKIDEVYGGREVYDEWIRLTNLPNVLVSQGMGHIQDLDNPPCKENKDACPKLIGAPVVTWDGKMILCCRDFFRKSITGDLTKEPFYDVFERHKEIYREQKKGVFKGICKGCDHLHREDHLWATIAHIEGG